MYYKKYIIKSENIPESYFEKQKEIALERGFGHIDIDDHMRDSMIIDIINDQKKSLDVWLDYLINKESIYPEWFKYYVFQGMIKLGTYDKETETFNRRTDKTINKFIDLNREALSLVYDSLTQYLNKNKTTEEELNKLLESGSFNKLYAYYIKKLESINKEINDSKDGIWVKYNQGEEPNKLVNSLQGKGTGWCTAGYETAKNQLQVGDFYVYYTKDNNGEYNQPRIAIRMENETIGEIRGIGEHQNMEPEMEEVLNEKLKDFPDREQYMKKVLDMKLLTKIYNEYQIRELTEEEIKFLYEVENKISGFGYQKDPRIEEILEARNWKKDLAFVFKCSEDEISDNKQDVLDGKIVKYFYGDLKLDEITDAENLVLPEIVNGNLNLIYLKHAKNLIISKTINGTLDLCSLISAKDLIFPKKIESLYLSSLISVERLVLPEIIEKTLSLSQLTSVKNITLPKSLESLSLGITSAEGLVLPQTIKNLSLHCLKSLENLEFPKAINGTLNLCGLISAKNLKLPETLKSLILNRLTSVDRLILPKIITEYLDLSSLISLEEITISEEFECRELLSRYFTIDDLINKSLEHKQK